MNHEAARAVLASALEIDPAALGPDPNMENCEAWTSVAHLRLVLALEEQLGVELSPEDSLAIQSLADVSRLLQAAAPSS